jgi:hypothetical protein
MHSRHGTHRRVEDWTSADGAIAKIVQYGQTKACGTIDGVTPDGTIVWIQNEAGNRRLFERCESFEVWVPRDQLGLNYRVSRAVT